MNPERRRDILLSQRKVCDVRQCRSDGLAVNLKVIINRTGFLEEVSVCLACLADAMRRMKGAQQDGVQDQAG